MWKQCVILFICVLIGVGVKGGLPLRDLGGALCHVSSPVLRCHPDVVPWFPYERLADGERGLSDEIAPSRAVLRGGGPFVEGRRGDEVLEVAFEEPAESYLLAASDARYPHPR